MASWHCRSRSSKVPWLMFRWVGRACAAGIFGSAARTPGFGKGRSGGSQPIEWASCYWPYICKPWWPWSININILIYNSIYTQYIHVYPVSGCLHQHVSKKHLAWNRLDPGSEVARASDLSWAQLGSAQLGIPRSFRSDPSRIPMGSPAVGSRFQHLN